MNLVYPDSTAPVDAFRLPDRPPSVRRVPLPILSFEVVVGRSLDNHEKSDEQLMACVQAGNVRAFEELYARHHANARNVALSVTKNVHQAEDAVQEAFLSVWRGRSTFGSQPGHSVRGWIMTVVRSRAIDAIRRGAAKKRPPPDGIEPDDVADPSSGSPLEEILARADREAMHDSLQASLKRLPDTQAEIVSLAYFEEMTHSEIAMRLSLPEGTVKGRIRLAKQKLRRGLDPEDQAAPRNISDL